MKLSLTTKQLDMTLKALEGLRKKLQQQPVRWSLHEDGISAFDNNGLEIGFVNIGGSAPGSGWVQNKNHESETIFIRDLLA